MKTISISVVKYFKLHILVLMVMINRFPHFFNASMYTDIIKEQIGKKTLYILAFFVSHFFQILNDCTKQHSLETATARNK